MPLHFPPTFATIAILAICSLPQFSAAKLSSVDERLQHPGPKDGALNVHLVTHTHDDTGWLKTVDQYHWGSNNTIQNAGTQYILSSTVEALKKDPTRKFTYVEQAFFSRWWDEQPDSVKADVRKLVANGQLQFSNGGWCMHDEANPHYIDMIDQTTLGHDFLKRHLNTTAETGWQIDPFGHSSTHAWLMTAKVGFKGYFFGRSDYQDFAYREAQKTREFWWQGSQSLPDQTIFTGILLSNHYGPPDGFYWDGIDSPRSVDPIMDDPRLKYYNVQDYVEKFVQTATANFNVTRGKHIMWTMGNDFNYQDAEYWFTNMDKLIKAVNKDGRFNVFYSTVNEYAEAKLQESANDGVKYPVNTHDFFPYEDNAHSFWTGYFTSRPALKRYVRTSSAYYTATRQVAAMAQLGAGPNGTFNLPERLPLADAMGLAQHHDAIAGTAKQHVAFDYAQRIAAAMNDDLRNFSSALAGMAGFSAADRQRFTMCLLANVSECEATRSWSGHASLPVLVWNSLARRRTATVRIPMAASGAGGGGVPSIVALNDAACSVLGNEVVESQDAIWQYGRGNPRALPRELVLSLRMPALGACVLHIASTKADDGTEKVVSTTATVSQARSGGGPIIMSNDHVAVEFGDISRGEWVRSITDRRHNLTISIEHDWCFYWSNTGDKLSSQASGAYIFRPQTNTTCNAVTKQSTVRVVSGGGLTAIVERNVTFAPTQPGAVSWITERLLLTGNATHVTHEFTVGPIPVDVSGDVGMEVVSRVKTSVKSNGALYTDSNGREMQHRLRDKRFTFPFTQHEPIAGNYYPINTMAHLNDTAAQFTILVDSSVGGGSIEDGALELMVHRRVLHDDSRGVSEPLNETEFVKPYWPERASWNGQHFGPALLIRGSHDWVLTPSGSEAARVVRPLLDEKYAIPQVLFGPEGAAPSHPAVGSVVNGIGTALPPQLQLTTLQQIGPKQLLVRVSHQLAVYEDPHGMSEPVSFSIQALLQNAFSIASLEEVSLTTTKSLGTFAGDATFTIDAMDVRTFLVNLK